MLMVCAQLGLFDVSSEASTLNRATMSAEAGVRTLTDQLDMIYSSFNGYSHEWKIFHATNAQHQSEPIIAGPIKYNSVSPKWVLPETAKFVVI